MELKFMEWNLHQQGRQFSGDLSKDNDIPLWIVDCIPEDINVIVFTEFNSHANNIQIFYDNLKMKGFCYSSTRYSCGWANDILIAVRFEGLDIIGTSFVKAYPDVPDTTLNIEWNNIPDNNRLDIRVNNNSLHLWGIRIKELKKDYKKRNAQMKTMIEWIKNTGGINMILGDFNNLREGTPVSEWNLSVLDKLLGNSLERKTPVGNHSWGVSKDLNNQFDGYIKNDHLIISKTKGLKAEVNEKYDWDFLKHVNYKLEKLKYDKQNLDIPVGEPDHGILFGYVVIDE